MALPYNKVVLVVSSGGCEHLGGTGGVPPHIYGSAPYLWVPTCPYGSAPHLGVPTCPYGSAPRLWVPICPYGPHIYGSAPHLWVPHTGIALELFLFPPPQIHTKLGKKTPQKNPTKYPKVQKWPQIRHPDNNVGLCPTSGGLCPIAASLAPKWGSVPSMCGSVPHSAELSPKVGLCAPPMCGSVPHSTELSP